jgi:hypothetical protein
MSSRDPRLIPLIDTLNDVGLDWIAREIVAVIREGLLDGVGRDELSEVQSKVRNARTASQLDQRASQTPTPLRLEGDDQIRWARGYISERIGGAIAMADASLSNLSAIVGVNPELHGDLSFSDSQVSIVLAVDDRRTTISLSANQEATAALNSLNEWLTAWERQALGSGDAL